MYAYHESKSPTTECRYVIPIKGLPAMKINDDIVNISREIFLHLPYVRIL